MTHQGCTNYTSEGDEYGKEYCAFYADGAKCVGQKGQCQHQVTMPDVHELKIQQPHFQDVLDGLKTAEIRKTDRDFQVGDAMVLKEYQPPAYEQGGVSTRDGHYTGRQVETVITHILTGWGLQDGYAMLSFKAVKR